MHALRRKALVISYYFPPIDAVGAQRPMSFFKYLPDHGYDVFVLTTARHGAMRGGDPERVFRAGEPYGYLVRPLRNLLMRRISREQRAGRRVLSTDSLLARLQNWVLIPDQAVTWYPFALRRALRLWRTRPFDIVLSTSPPETAHLVALALKRRLGVPFVADFRDGWLFEGIKPSECYEGWQGWIRRRLERSVVQGADRVLAVTPGIVEDFRKRFPQLAENVVLLTNGYDGEEVRRVRRFREAGDAAFVIAYAGALSLSRPGRSAEPFLRALADVLRENAFGIRDHLKVLFLGEYTDDEAALPEKLGLGSWVSFREWGPRSAALQFLADADVLLLITERGRTGVATAKLFDYIGVRRPILALAKGDAAGGIVEELRAGEVVDREDTSGIAAAIVRLFRRWRSGSLGLEGPPPVKYERSHQAGVLARLLDSVLAQQQRGGE